MRFRLTMASCVILSSAAFIFAAGCSHRAPTERDLFNVDAALPAGVPVQPLDWKVITSNVDREHHTMSTLFGNDVAVRSARSGADTVTYQAGSTLALVTWAQRDDEHWFGGRIPDRVLSMEMVTVAAGAEGATRATYQRFGATGQLASGSEQDATREKAILTERAASMP